jgi:predicted PolB exonuclease-like 3'-5' exonuclease
MENIIVWDIETIPQVTPFSDLQKEKMKNKVDYYVEKGQEKGEAERLVAATNPFYGHVICISMYEESDRFDQPNKATIVATPIKLANGLYKPAEKDLLDDFWAYIKDFKGLFVGFNSLKFDAWFVQIRSMKHGITPTNEDFLDFRQFQSYPHYDIMQHLANWAFSLRPSLDLACDFFGIPTPKEGEVKASTVSKAYQEGKIKEIAEYAMRDVEATHEIYKITKNYLKKNNGNWYKNKNR